jgi:hypothetical protein
MINLFNAQIESLSVHKIGNKSRNEQLFLSDSPLSLNDEITPILKEYFFKPFRDKEESYYRFAHDVDLEYNEMYGICSSIFTPKFPQQNTHDLTKSVAKYLYEQHNHPHIKTASCTWPTSQT